MKNQSVNWSLFTKKISNKSYTLLKLDTTTDTKTVFIVDDSLDERYGKKVETTDDQGKG